MRCHQAQKLISEYVDGALDERRAARLEEHLAKCAECREMLKDFQEIVRRARSQKTVVPPDRVWQRISGALEGPRAGEAAGRRDRTVAAPVRGWFWARHPWVSAAAAALVIAVGGFVLLRPGRTGAPLGPEARDQYTLAKLDEAKGFYRQAIQSLNEAVAAQKGTLDPQVAAVFAQNLAKVDASIEACQAAVRRDPHNLDNQGFLLAAYKDKMGILTDLVAVKRASSPGGPSAATAL
jgi:hypothetical protein